jgi:hypothetical protein
MYGRMSAAAERAVESHGKRLHVAHRIPERLGRLPGQRAARRVGDGPRHDQRQPLARALEVRLDGEQRRLGVQRVEDGLDEQDVRPALAQPATASAYVAARSSKLTLRAPGSLTSGEIDAVRLVGPIAPATKRGLSGVRAVHASAHSRAILAAA